MNDSEFINYYFNFNFNFRSLSLTKVNPFDTTGLFPYPLKTYSEVGGLKIVL